MPLDNTIVNSKADDVSFLDSAWGLASGTVVSAANDIGNSVGIIGETIGVNSYEETKTRDAIEEYAGQTAAEYYDRNPHLVEGAGLLVGTMLPGAAGVKALRAAQAAKGSMLGQLLRLPHSTLDEARAASKAAMVASDNLYGALNQHTLKALVAGAGANVLDMAAFEVAATAATFASPVYSDFTAGDYAASMAKNIAFGGAIGTVFSGAKTAYGTATATLEANKATAAIRNVTVGDAKQTPWVNLTGLMKQHDPEQAIIEVKKLGGTDAMIAGVLPTRDAAIRAEVTTEIGRIAPDPDAALAFNKLLFSTTKDGKPVDAVSITALAKEVRRGTLDDTSIAGRTFDTVTGEAFDAGVVPTKHLGDSLPAGHKIFADGDRLLVVGESGKPTVMEIGKDFKALGEVEAQAAWLHAAPEQMKHVELEVAAGDLPKMERLLELSDEALAKRPAIVGGKLLRTHDEIKKALLDEKYLQAEALSGKLLPEQIMTRLNVPKAFLEEARFSNMIARDGKELEHFLRSPRHVSVIYDIPKLSSAVEKFISPRALTDGAAAEISAASFIRMRGNEEVRPLVLGAIQKKLADGHKITAPTITVKKDGSLVLDGNKRATALSKMMNDLGAETDHIPVNIKVDEGAVIPAALPDGSPFPVMRNATGQVVQNPAALELPARLSAAFQEESLWIENLNKLNSQERELVAASLMADSGTMPPEELLLSLTEFSTSRDAGQKFITASESITGGLGGATQHIGQLTNKLIRSTNEVTDAAINAPVMKLLTKEGYNDAAQLVMVANNLRGNTANYVLDRVTGSLVREDIAINARKALQAAEVKARWDAASAAGAISPAQLKQFRTEMKAASSKAYPPEGAGVERMQLGAAAFEYVAASTARNTERMAIHTKVNATVGSPSLTTAQQHGLERVYFAPVNTKKYPHFVFVRQTEGISSTSHTSVVTAASAEALATKVKLLQRDFPGMEFVGNPKSNYQFLYKKDIEAFHKAKGDYEYARGMNDNAIDSALKSKKMMYEPEGAPVDERFVKEFFDDQIDWHRRMDAKSVRDVVELKYGQFFRQLEVLGGAYTKTGTSFFGASTASAASYAAQSVKNPYGDLIKQALDIGKQLEYPMWMKANEFLNTGWSKASLQIRKAGIAMNEAAHPRDLEAEAANLNRLSNELGFGNPYEAGMLAAYKELLPLNPSLSGHIAKSNAALNFLVLGSDMLQALNTLIGTTLHATEYTALTGAIRKQNSALAGKLTGLAQEDVPSGVEMLARSAQEFFTGGEVWNVAKGAYEHQTGKQIMDEMIKNGLRVGDAKAIADAMDHFAYNPKLSADAFGKAAEAGMEAIRKLTGNTTADAVSRFMAARSMQILTDKALQRGLLASKAEANIYITQHVTRVHGATLASQRPVMFSGPIGQSVGVFLTFYTNFLQRMFQHAGAGDKGALATMAGMQVGLYGLQGLPAFNFVNTHLIGNVSGNKDHMDIYQAAGGSEEAKWIMFGAGSSLLGLIHPDLRVNLYSRGDLNPRQASIIPITPQDTALYSAVSKTASNLGQLAQHISGGAGIGNSLAFALEHNGVNRPLSGLGALLSGGQTTGKATLMSDYSDGDLSGFAIAARLAGGKPLDDATAADALYRNNAYKAATASRINNVGENLRVAMQDGGQPDMIGFMQEYTHAGGNVKNFNKFVKKQFLSASNSQISKAAADMGTPQAASLSRLMSGGFVAPDVEGEE